MILNLRRLKCVSPISIMKTIEIDSDTLKKLQKIKIRPDESLSSVVCRLAIYGYDWQPLTEEFITWIPLF